MKRVFVCSPYAGNVDRNHAIAVELCRMVLARGDAAYAPHVHYHGILEDQVPEDRELAIASGLAYLETCDEILAYVGSGISQGMKRELACARALGKSVVEINELPARRELMTKVKRKKYVCVRQNGETFITWAESPAAAKEQCASVAWQPWRVLRLPGAVQIDWVQEDLPCAVVACTATMAATQE
jgi:hypothetical protein